MCRGEHPFVFAAWIKHFPEIKWSEQRVASRWGWFFLLAPFIPMCDRCVEMHPKQILTKPLWLEPVLPRRELYLTLFVFPKKNISDISYYQSMGNTHWKSLILRHQRYQFVNIPFIWGKSHLSKENVLRWRNRRRFFGTKKYVKMWRVSNWPMFSRKKINPFQVLAVTFWHFGWARRSPITT